MKKYIYIYLIIGVGLLPLTVSSQSKSLNFAKEFEVQEDAVVSVNSHYGDVYIGSWNQDRVGVKIEMSAEGKSAELLQEIADHMQLSIDGNADKVSIQSNIEDITHWNKSNRKISIRFKNGKKYELEALSLHYTIQMPASLKLEMEHSYGDIQIDELSKGANIYLSYGDLDIDKLEGQGNIVLKYGDADIDYLEKGEIRASYGDIAIDYARNITFAGKYSDVKIGKADSMYTDASYIDYELGQVDYLHSEENHSSFDIWELIYWGKMELSFGDVSISKLSESFQSVNIKGAYTDVDVSIIKGSNYQFDLSTVFGSIKYPSATQISERISTKDKEKVVGETGGNSTSKISVNTAYGDISVR